MINGNLSVRDLVKLFVNGLNKFDEHREYYLGTLIPMLVQDPSKGTKTEYALLKKIKEKMSIDEWGNFEYYVKLSLDDHWELTQGEIEEAKIIKKQEKIKKEAALLAENKAKRLKKEKILAEKREKEKQEKRKNILKEIRGKLRFRLDEARLFYTESCKNFITEEEFEKEVLDAFSDRFIEAYFNHSLSEIDFLCNSWKDVICFSRDECDYIKSLKVGNILNDLGVDLDEEQLMAVSASNDQLLIRARAGSGKTRTLAAIAALAIAEKKIDPNSVLILAFNRDAANEIKERVKSICKISEYENARTFHSLACRLVRQKGKLLFDKGEHPSEEAQSLFVQKLIYKILNPVFKQKVMQFFRKEIEQVDRIGRNLPMQEYFQFRRALQYVTLGGKKVKSNGEKFIADFLFEHGIVFQYEKIWEWKVSFGENTAYKPDFSIICNGKDYILEHWAIDPDDPFAKLPDDWNISTSQYRQQIVDKRNYWKSKDITLLETHTGLMKNGRESFEDLLKNKLQSYNIECKKLDQEEIVEKVFNNDFIISRLSKLFLQFIQRAKKNNWSVEDASRFVNESNETEPRTKMFLELALRVFNEYQLLLDRSGAIDYDDLLSLAVLEIEKYKSSAKIVIDKERSILIGDLRYVLIDEYQDFSYLFYKLISAILSVNHDVKIVSVGDDWQAINSFAGAQLCFFTDYAKYFPGAGIKSISTNYRSSKSVVRAGNMLMFNYGLPAKCKDSADIGLFKDFDTDEVWIELRNGQEYFDQRQYDSIFFPQLIEVEGSGNKLRLAKVFKKCVEIIPTDPDASTLLLARTKFIYGVEINEFRKELLRILAAVRKVDSDLLKKNIVIKTVHTAKGLQAHTVIVLDATEKQFPKIHPDNLLFEIFGTNVEAVIEEELRLFYVAITRAEYSAYCFWSGCEKSPFISMLNDNASSHMFKDVVPSVEEQKNGWLVQTIKEKIAVRSKEYKKNGKYFVDTWDDLRATVSASLGEFISFLEASKFPAPEADYYLPNSNEDLFAEIAWPNNTQKIAVLAGEQIEYSQKWIDSDWIVLDSKEPIDVLIKIVSERLNGAK